MTTMNSSSQNTDLLQAFNEFNSSSDVLTKSYDQLNESFSAYIDKNSDTDNDEAPASMSQPLRALLDAIPGAVIVINTQGQVVDVNAAAIELLGEPLKNELWRDVVNRVFLTELDQGELRTVDGRQFSISTRPLGYQPGQILLLSDVTQTRQLQRAAQQNLHLMTMGKMMASLAHQIRTPLSSSMLYLSQIVDGSLSAEKNSKFTEKALARIKHIETMINDMLVFAHGGQFHMTDFTISDLLNELKDQLLPHLKQKHAVLNLDVPDKVLLINGNRVALLGAMANLCMNAMDAREKDLNISIKVQLGRKGNLVINVSDNGCGMDEKTLEHLFDPFFTTKMDGTGLGLAVVKSVIESHQGGISVASTVGKGSDFEIYIPCVQANKTQISHASQRES